MPRTKTTSLLLGPKMRALRQQRALSLQELANQLSTTDGYISQVERGIREPRAAFVFQVARALGVSSDLLLDDDTELTPPATSAGPPATNT